MKSKINKNSSSVGVLSSKALRKASLPLCLLVACMASSAQAALMFTINATATNSELGYTAGQDYTFSFSYLSASTAPTFTFNQDFFLNYLEERISEDEQLWAGVSGDGLAGAWSRPNLVDGSPDSRLTARVGGVLALEASTDSGASTGLMTVGLPMESIQFEASYSGLSFDLSASQADPNVYFLDYLGTYSATSTSTAFIEPVDFNVSNALFTVNSLTISVIPEPSSIALLGLGGLAFMLRRRRQD